MKTISIRSYERVVERFLKYNRDAADEIPGRGCVVEQAGRRSRMERGRRESARECLKATEMDEEVAMEWRGTR